MAAASTTNSSDQVLVGASGTVYTAPASATITAPTAEDSVLDTDLLPLGFVSPDGITVRDSKEVGEVMAWQTPYPVRRLVTGRTFEVEFELEQVNWTTLPFALGGGTITIPVAGKYKYVPPDADDLDERAMVIDWVDGTRNYRLWIPSGIVTAPVEFTVKRDEAVRFPITFAAIYDGTNNPFELFTDDPAFQNA